MKPGMASMSALVIVFGLALLTLAGNGDATSLCDYKEYGLDAEKFFRYLTEDTPYVSWQLWPGKGTLYPGKEPHGPFLTTYVNPVAHRSITDKKGMAFGSLIVTENYGRDKKLSDLTVKIKLKGYNPGAGDWYWFKYAADGRVMAAGRVDTCIECHRNMRENDYTVTGPVK